jgi:hypothetical protein
MCAICEAVNRQGAVISASVLLGLVAEGADLPTAVEVMKADLRGSTDDLEMIEAGDSFIDGGAALLAERADRLRSIADNLFRPAPDTAEGI